MEHKFVIEVRLRHEPPKVDDQPKAQCTYVKIDPKKLQSALSILSDTLTTIQKKEEASKKKN